MVSRSRRRPRFLRDDRGAVVGDRAFNATQVGEALLGGQLLSVANDPANPNRQVALLRGDLELESTVVGRRSKPEPAGVAREVTQEKDQDFLADELTLLVLHGPGGARISRVEQWQASYPSPEQRLVAQASGSHHLWLLLSRTP